MAKWTYIRAVMAAMLFAGYARVPATSAEAPPKKPVAPPIARFALPLNGAWSTRLEIPTVPASWQSEAAADAQLEAQPSERFFKASGAVWYWKRFSIPEGWQGKTRILRLQFDAVAENAEVWLNGTSLGKHSGGGVPFDFNVTKSAKIGGENLLALRVTAPIGRVGGIYRGVRLIAHDEAYVSYIWPQTDVFGHVNMEIHLLNTSTISGSATIDVTLSPADTPVRSLQKSNQEVLLTPGSNISTFITSLRSRDLHLWNPDSPNVYLLKATFHQGKDLLDELELPVGFRTITVDQAQWMVNDKPIAITPTPPDYRLAAGTNGTDDEQKLREQLQSLKGSGTTTLFLSAPSPELLRLADLAGLLVVESPRQGLSSAAAHSELAALVERDRHHPCIAAWWLKENCSADELASLRKMDPNRVVEAGTGASTKIALPGKRTFEPGPAPAALRP